MEFHNPEIVGLLDELTQLRCVHEDLRKAITDLKSQLVDLRKKILVHKKKERVREQISNFKNWTDEGQIAAVQRFVVEYQRSPVTSDFKNLEWLPDPTSVCRRWGSLAALRKAAGFVPGLSGRGGSGRGGGNGRYKEREKHGAGSKTGSGASEDVAEGSTN